MVHKPTQIHPDVMPDIPTQQSSADEFDINKIVERAKRGADVSGLIKPNPVYADMTKFPDYREALLTVNRARDAFMSLDARVRERFQNDPAGMLDFLSDPKNRQEAIELGLVNKPAEVKKDEHLETLKSIDTSLKKGVHPKKSSERADD